MRRVLLAAAFLVSACAHDFDKFEASAPADGAAPPPAPDSGGGPPDAGSRDAGAAVDADAAVCRSAPAACLSQRSTCRDGCDAARKTCEDACEGGTSGISCRVRCSQERSRCESTCDDTCRSCAGACTEGCR